MFHYMNCTSLIRISCRCNVMCYWFLILIQPVACCDFCPTFKQHSLGLLLLLLLLLLILVFACEPSSWCNQKCFIIMHHAIAIAIAIANSCWYGFGMRQTNNTTGNQCQWAWWYWWWNRKLDFGTGDTLIVMGNSVAVANSKLNQLTAEAACLCLLVMMQPEMPHNHGIMLVWVWKVQTKDKTQLATNGHSWTTTAEFGCWCFVAVTNS